MNDRIEIVARAICEAVDGPADDVLELSYHKGSVSLTIIGTGKPRWRRHIKQARIQIAAFDALREMEKI